MHKKIFLTIACIFFLINTQKIFAAYTPELGSRAVIEKYNLTSQNLDKDVTRQYFIETLSLWYPDYAKKKGKKIDFKITKELDNKKYFQDVDIQSDFGRKLQYFVQIGAIKKAPYFNPKATLPQSHFFLVMRRLGVMNSLENCKSLKICEQETTSTALFHKGIYLKYISKILNRDLRKIPIKAKDFITLGYKPYLSPSYNFPLRVQSKNACYFFSVKNILLYKYGYEINVQQLEKKIGKDTNKISSVTDIYKFNSAAGVKEEKFRTIESLFTNLQKGEPLSISYMIEIMKDGKKIKVPHIVAAYSFDEEGIWVSETVSGKHKRIPYDEVFQNGKTTYNPMRSFSLVSK